MLTTTLHRSLRSSHVFLAASVLIHALLLCIPLPTQVVPKETVPQNRLFAVELLIPELETKDIANKDTPEAPPALFAPPPPKPPIKENEKSPTTETKKTMQPQAREATVSLNRLSDDDMQYRSYLGHLRSQINAVWEYPLAARNKGLNGTVTIRFSIAQNGRLEALTIKENSPHQLLDNEALRTIKAAAPFMPFPSDFSIEKLHVLASFEYEFSSR
jgi:TonB family protein